MKYEMGTRGGKFLGMVVGERKEDVYWQVSCGFRIANDKVIMFTVKNRNLPL